LHAKASQVACFQSGNPGTVYLIRSQQQVSVLTMKPELKKTIAAGIMNRNKQSAKEKPLNQGL
jgi:hypothetical protein